MEYGFCLLLNAIDYATGILKAIKNKNLSSAKMFDGILKKGCAIILYLLLFVLSKFSSLLGLSFPDEIKFFVLVYIALTEILSIIENLNKINSNLIPKKFMKYFENLK